MPRCPCATDCPCQRVADAALAGDRQNARMRPQPRNGGLQEAGVESAIEPTHRLHEQCDHQKHRSDRHAASVRCARVAGCDGIAQRQHREGQHRIGMIRPAFTLQQEDDSETDRKRHRQKLRGVERFALQQHRHDQHGAPQRHRRSLQHLRKRHADRKIDVAHQRPDDREIVGKKDGSAGCIDADDGCRDEKFRCHQQPPVSLMDSERADATQNGEGEIRFERQRQTEPQAGDTDRP